MVAQTSKSYLKFIRECLRYVWGTGTQIGYQIDPGDVKKASARSQVDTGSTSGFKRNSVLRIFIITKTGFFDLVEISRGFRGR